MQGGKRLDRPSLGNVVWHATTPLVLLAGFGLLYLAFRSAPLPQIWETLRRIQIWQLLLVVCLDVAVYLLFALRWWLIARSFDPASRYLPMVVARLAAFGLSYFTVGPQVGGEAVQAMHLRRRYGMSYAHAIASVLLDKLIELLANFLFLLVGIVALFQTGAFGAGHLISPLLISGLSLLAAWPLLHLWLLRNGRLPVSRVLAGWPGPARRSRVVRHIRVSEQIASRFCRRETGSLLAAVAGSLAACGLGVIEYGVIASSLNIPLGFWQIASAWVVAWLSFLVPLPGGLGALEASQVLALGLFGVAAASALGVALVMRGRDLLIGAVGILLAGSALKSAKSGLAVRDVVPSVKDVE